MDRFSREKRLEVMSRIRGKHTEPELVVRRLLHRMGFRFRLHRKDLPGSPDIVLPKWRTAVFVQGCFWHGHCCVRSHRPLSNPDFWASKFGRNRKRDARSIRMLRSQGWRVMLVWECQLKELQSVEGRFRRMRDAGSIGRWTGA